MLKNQLIGLFGGAFDPIHNAHISIAKESIEQIGLNKIMFIPTGGSANNKTLVNHRHRLEMINLICNNSHFEVSDFEIKEYLNIAGIDSKNYSGHSLRSGFATVSAESGADERSIMTMTGHKSTEMVRRYIKEANLFKNNALNKIKL